jgi:hypothetical protein
MALNKIRNIIVAMVLYVIIWQAMNVFIGPIRATMFALGFVILWSDR